MARRKSKRPKLFESKQAPKRAMDNVGKAFINKTLDAGMQAAQDQKPNKDTQIKVNRKPKYLEVTEKRLTKMGVVDLKPFFSHSRSRKLKKGGGWYVRIPIKVKKKDMSRRMYDQLRTINISPDNQRTVISDYLYDRRQASDSSLLNYTPVSYNITKQKTGKRKHTYVAFRTVSDKSPTSSWIINRDKVNTDDTSKTFIRNVNRLMKWKAKNGWE
ncbi:hypothetical protein CPT_Moonbeam60 [Bacillus phage Moonbeam]|uniref:Uncharacterized protein n=1 Tax=Bacillus phage Moonbeam TaxID=1540091 RepID=A0A0A0RV29_9CAUD|nr:hypothetical protein CPT_Moonbeam60 [Bacillus phage Moonbeam]AIW03458.1 hypothetical protein CPT_Moonbeam60 [Bacillus phage Moonbeam]